jgi:hypothetical protein
MRVVAPLTISVGQYSVSKHRAQLIHQQLSMNKTLRTGYGDCGLSWAQERQSGESFPL